MMNELIRELADRARFVKTTDYPSQDEVFEKFAELIVQKCSQVSLTVSHRNDDMGAIIARMIKEHFGVEE